MQKKPKECLMLETSDKKRFFTSKKNYSKLLEFANRFNYKISTVRLEEGEILELNPLATAISTERYCKGAKFEIIELKKPPKKL